VVTFYSYKGGTGRSQALANVAWVLAAGRKRVLVIDWDLEAPGLHRYFAPFLADSRLAGTRGLIEFFIAQADAALSARLTPEAGADRKSPTPDMTAYATRIDYPFPEPGVLHLVPAGRQDPLYGERVRSFDWKGFYERLNGAELIDRVREDLTRKYDYVLIDSRTGVADTAGICTIQLPDDLVVCFTANNQSILGGAGVAADVRRAAEAGRPRIFPLFARKDTFEKDKLDRRWELARAEFGKLPAHLSEEERADYWARVGVPYVSYYAYEEVLAAFGAKPGLSDEMLVQTELLTAALTDGAVSKLAAVPTPEERAIALSGYAGGPAVTPAPEVADRAFDAVVCSREEDANFAESLVDQLTRAGRRVFWTSEELWSTGRGETHYATASPRDSSTVVLAVGQAGISETTRRACAYFLKAGQGHRILVVLLPGTSLRSLPDDLSKQQVLQFEAKPADAPSDVGRVVAAIRGVPALPHRRGSCPYRGLAAFSEADADLFFGREALVRNLLATLTDPTAERDCLIVSGPPGSGASSVVRAGLVPRLRIPTEPGVVPVQVAICSPGGDALEGLAVAVVREAGVAQDGSDTSAVRDLIRAMAEDENGLHLFLRTRLPQVRSKSQKAARTVLVVDQAHEAFGPSQDHVRREQFFRNLAYAARAIGSRATVVFAARDSARIAVEGYFPSALKFALATPNEQELREVIEKPAALAGLVLESGLTELLLRDLDRGAGALPLLQLALVGLWNARDGDRLTVAAYRKEGGIDGWSRRQAEQSYAGLPYALQQAAKRLLIRVSLREAPVVDANSPATGTEEGVVLGALTAARVVTTDGADDGRVVFTHRLLPELWPLLKTWIDEERRSRESTSPVALAAPVAAEAVTQCQRPPLAVWVLWHPKWGAGASLAERLYADLAGDAGLDRPGIGIPVRFRSEPVRGGKTPPDVDLDSAEQTALVVLGSGHLAVDEDWRNYLERVRHSVQVGHGRHRLILVQFTPSISWWSFGSMDNVLRLDADPVDDADLPSRFVAACVRQLLHFAARGETGDGRQWHRLFVSYAKQDGMKIANVVLDRLRSDWPESSWVFDANSPIVAGTEFSERLQSDLTTSTLLAIHTDAYASRAWCRYEARAAKKAGSPMVVVHALQRGEERGLAELANVPAIQWAGTNADDVLAVVARESLRCLVARRRFDFLSRSGGVGPAAFSVRRPQPMDGAPTPADAAAPRLTVYPDPVLDDEELAALASWTGPGAAFVTLTGDDRSPFLAGRRVGLSVSNPDEADLGWRGLGPQHFQDMMTALSRRLLSHGADLAHCGDLRAVGLGPAITDLVRGLLPSDSRGPRVVNFLAWPIYLDLDVELLARNAGLVSYLRVPPPPDLVAKLPLDPTVRLEADSAANRLRNRAIRSRCLTAMREQLLRGVDAVVVAGGKVTGYLGNMPGVVEELLLALDRGIPVYVLGGFGGAAAAVAEALRGRTPEELTEAFQRVDSDGTDSTGAEKLSAILGAGSAGRPSFAEIVSRLRGLGPEGLRNGLTRDENLRLMATDDRDEVAFMVARGLRRVGNEPLHSPAATPPRTARRPVPTRSNRKKLKRKK
jgi:hypothetical protein